MQRLHQFLPKPGPVQPSGTKRALVLFVLSRSLHMVIQSKDVGDAVVCRAVHSLLEHRTYTFFFASHTHILHWAFSALPRPVQPSSTMVAPLTHCEPKCATLAAATIDCGAGVVLVMAMVGLVALHVIVVQTSRPFEQRQWLHQFDPSPTPVHWSSTTW